MGKYSIKELEQLSGIKAHTIRIWEKRYSIIQPQRTATNIRFYSDDDLKKIINISLLNNNGFKISKIVNLTIADLSKKVAELSDEKSDVQVSIDQLVIAMIDLDEGKFIETINQLTRDRGFESTISNVVYPFLEKIGIMWHTGAINPAQEHFITQLIRQKLIVAIDQLAPARPDASAAVLFLPESELHELGLLFFHYLVKKEGYQTWYLGQTVPYKDIHYVCTIQNPSLIVSSVSNLLSPIHVQEYFDKICLDFPNAKILVTGGGLKKVDLAARPNLTILAAQGVCRIFYEKTVNPANYKRKSLSGIRNHSPDLNNTQ